MKQDANWLDVGIESRTRYESRWNDYTMSAFDGLRLRLGDEKAAWEVEAFDIDLAYAHFYPGSFTQRTGDAPPSDFVQIAATVRF